ncbi:MAG: hypothetical protein FJZ11_05785 [Candidatus Omnitrophica bacterium]|nr:hypothetical protein [Candidatus Omnitrophota bacterium]
MIPRNNKGQFIKEQHYSPQTEFQKGCLTWNKGTGEIYKDKKCQYCSKIFHSYVKTRKFCSFICYSHHPETLNRLKTLGLGNSPWNKGLKNVTTAWNKGKSAFWIKGDKNPNWNGGRRKAGKYISILSPHHPHGSRGYVREHRLIAETLLGRYLKITEIIHHINGNGKDNNPQNLYLFSSEKEHSKFHKCPYPLITNLIVKEQN